MKRLFIITFILYTLPIFAHTLHIGNTAFQLDAQKRTVPALGIAIGDMVVYGALYTGQAPDKTLRINYGDTYWLGQNCPAGMYSETGISQCTDCGIGHYCAGATERASCTYGAILCNSTNHDTDPELIAGAPINKLMTLDEANQFIPVTDLSDWRKLSSCNVQNNATPTNPETLKGTSKACAHGTIGPGTYLFVTRYGPSAYVSGLIDCIDGTENAISNVFIAVFDHPVGYASIHGHSLFQHFIDTEHPIYEEYTILTAPHWALATK